MRIDDDSRNEIDDEEQADLDKHVEPDADDDDQDKADYAFARWAAQSDSYAALFKIWARAILFLVGKQWLEWDERSKRYAPETGVPKWKQRPVTNLVFAVYRAALAKLTKQKPAFDVVPPQNGDSDDRAAAAIGDALLKQFWTLLGFGKMLGRAIGWLLACGNVYVEVYWDPEGGKLIPLTVPMRAENPVTGEYDEVDCPCDEEGNPFLLRDGTPDLEAEPIMVFEGQVARRLISPLNVRMDPGCTDDDEATEYLYGDLVPVAEACRLFDLKPEDIRLNEDDTLEEFEDLIARAAGVDQMLGIVQNVSGDRDEEIGDRCLVLRYYRKPCEDYPKGRHWVQVNRLAIADPETGEVEGPLPNAFWPPFVPIRDVPVPGQVHGMGLIGQCVSLNREYNVQNAEIKQHNKAMAMGGKWIVTPADKNIAINSDPGQKIVSDGYLMGLPPVQAKMEALPVQVYEERARILEDLFRVSGMNEMAIGQKPEGVSSGRGFLVMQEVVDSVLAPTLYQIELAMQEVGRRALVLARDHYTEKRVIKIRGKSGRWEVRSFMGADLGDEIDVQVQLGSSFPWSKAARLDTVITTIQALPGLVTDPTTGIVDTAKFAKLTDIGGMQAFEIDGDADLLEVEMEHAQFEELNPEDGTGEIPQPGFWQNHDAHFRAHAELMKRDRIRFEKWHPVARQAFIQHMLYHLKIVQGQAMAAMPQPPAGGEPTNTSGAPGEGAPAISGGGGPTPPPGPGPQLSRADFAAAGQ